MDDASRWRKEIESAYRESGNSRGWRLLYSPAHVLDGAKVAFLGLNPGGTYDPEAHADFATESGSAYVTECWEHRGKQCRAGESPLQIQVRKLFALLDVSAEDVLAGNLVPFRSPNWKSLKDRQAALRFGANLWVEILERAKPALVVCMGSETRDALCRDSQVNNLQTVRLNWGNVTAARGTFWGGAFVSLPHLSRYRVIGRPASEAAIDALFCRS